jgi:hypothetical protein
MVPAKFRLLLGLIAACAVTSGAARAEAPKECADGTATSVTGVIDKVTEAKGEWALWLKGQSGDCAVTAVVVVSQPPQMCRKGGKITASGKVFEDEAGLGFFFLEQVENLHCE